MSYALTEHRTAEEIQLVVLSESRGTDRQVLLTDTFMYHEDSSHYLARYLVDSVDNANALNDLDAIRGNGFDLSREDRSTLDTRLMKVFLDMKLPRDWNILGEDYNLPGNILITNTRYIISARG